LTAKRKLVSAQEHRRRVLAGLDRARARGVKLGRPRALDARAEAAVVQEIMNSDGDRVCLREIATRFAVAPSTIGNLLRRLAVVEGKTP
jgi:DNA invertase Pin-like site-specific DNA recombinase